MEIFFILIGITFLIFVYPYIKNRKCNICGAKMTRDLDDKNQIIFICSKCGNKIESNIFFGGGD